MIDYRLNMRPLYNAASKGLFEVWIKKKEELGVRKSLCLYGQLWRDQFWNIKFISGIYIRKGRWNLEMLQREVTKTTWDFKWVPHWEYFKEVHLFGLSKGRCRIYLTSFCKYLPNVNNVLLSLPKKNDQRPMAETELGRGNILNSYRGLLLGKSCQEKWRILHFLVSGNQKGKPFYKINPSRHRLKD